MRQSAWLVVLAACGTLGCGGSRTARDVAHEAANAAADSTASAMARAAATALGKELQGQLLAQLDRGGPAGAMAYCTDSAQALTARHAARGVYVRRVSLRVRNPANHPDSLERAALLDWQRGVAQGETPAEILQVREDAGRRTAYLIRPIVVQPKCLACHGDPASIDPSVRSLLAARYPADSAVGYSEGDLRGAISVRVPVSP